MFRIFVARMSPPYAYGTIMEPEGRRLWLRPRLRPRRHSSGSGSGSGSSAVNIEGEDEGFVILGDDIGAKWVCVQTFLVEEGGSPFSYL